MFEPDVLARVVDLQGRSYRLLRWVGESLRSGTLRFGVVHDTLEWSVAAREWVGRNRESLPPDVRPSPDELDAFAHLFASYLSTSFDLAGQASVQKASTTGCYCRFCAYLVAASRLRVKTPDRKAAQGARQMKELYLSALASETGTPLPYPALDALLSDPTLAEDIAWATYGREIVRRSQFASQGEGVLVLWREIAWDKRGKIRKNFALSAERILRAEAAIVGRWGAAAHHD